MASVHAPEKSGIIKHGLRSLFSRPDFHDPVVDGIRAIAILWVLILHIVFFHFGTYPDRVLQIFEGKWTSWIGCGALGVDLFFVISGYLIGTILLKEFRSSGVIVMRRFYARRLLRLMPVYVVVMCMGVYFMRNIPKSAILMDIAPSGNIEYAWTNLLYVNNFVTISKQYMGWCWSLAIEEQFYLVVPVFLLFVVGRTKHPLTWMIALLILSGIIRIVAIRLGDFSPPFDDPPDAPEWSREFDTIYDKAYMRFGGLLAGVIGAYASMFHQDALYRFFGNAARATLVACLSLAVICFFGITSFSSSWFETIPKSVSQTLYAYNHDLFSVATLMVILIAIYGRGLLATALKTLLSAKILYPIAQLSYSMYLLHEMFMVWMFPKTVPILRDSIGLSPNAVIWVNGIVVTLLTILVSATLYILVERPCMDYRRSRWFAEKLKLGLTHAPTLNAEQQATDVVKSVGEISTQESIRRQ